MGSGMSSGSINEDSLLEQLWICGRALPRSRDVIISLLHNPGLNFLTSTFEPETSSVPPLPTYQPLAVKLLRRPDYWPFQSTVVTEPRTTSCNYPHADSGESCGVSPLYMCPIPIFLSLISRFHQMLRQSGTLELVHCALVPVALHSSVPLTRKSRLICIRARGSRSVWCSWGTYIYIYPS